MDALLVFCRGHTQHDPKTAVQVTLIEESHALRDVRDAGSFAQHRLGTRQSQQKLKAMR